MSCRLAGSLRVTVRLPCGMQDYIVQFGNHDRESRIWADQIAGFPSKMSRALTFAAQAVHARMGQLRACHRAQLPGDGGGLFAAGVGRHLDLVMLPDSAAVVLQAPDAAPQRLDLLVRPRSRQPVLKLLQLFLEAGALPAAPFPPRSCRPSPRCGGRSRCHRAPGPGSTTDSRCASPWSGRDWPARLSACVSVSCWCFKGTERDSCVEREDTPERKQPTFDNAKPVREGPDKLPHLLSTLSRVFLGSLE